MPQVSVIIPVYNDPRNLRICLEGLRGSVEAPLECIVVDDGSTDNSPDVAREFGVKVLTTGERSGPALARNLGACAATGDVLLFIDADVCVCPDTVQKVRDQFARDPGLDALMGSYDSAPAASTFVSVYRNLLHHHAHQTSPGKATTFWAGCGGIRRSVFFEFGGFDEMYQAPAIEDIELGYRMAQDSRNVILFPDIQVKHHKRWTLRNTLRTDFFYRALPWSELSLRGGEMPDSLNLRISQRISVVLVFLVTLMAAYLTVMWHVYFLVPLFATFFILLAGYWVEGWAHHSVMVTAIMGGVLCTIAGVSLWFHMRGIAPLLGVAALALFLRHRYAYSKKERREWTGVWVGGYSLLTAIMVWIYFPWKPVVFLLFLLLLALVALNQQFYLFLAAKRGRFFALAAIPFHLLYFFSSGVAFLIEFTRFQALRFFGSPRSRNRVPLKKQSTNDAAP